MSESMIERVAKAIAASQRADWDRIGPRAKALFRTDARATLAAMREPTKAMVEAGRFPAEDDGPVACWAAMIDAALGLPLKEEG